MTSLRRAEAVLAVLTDSPATAYEVGVELGWTTRLASAWLSCLLTAGLVEHRGKIPSSFERARPPYLYGITKSGRARTARKTGVY